MNRVFIIFCLCICLHHLVILYRHTPACCLRVARKGGRGIYTLSAPRGCTIIIQYASRLHTSAFQNMKRRSGFSAVFSQNSEMPQWNAWTTLRQRNSQKYINCLYIMECKPYRCTPLEGSICGGGAILASKFVDGSKKFGSANPRPKVHLWGGRHWRYSPHGHPVDTSISYQREKNYMAPR